MDEQVPEAAGSNETTARLRERSARLSAAAAAAGEVSYRASADAGGPGEIAVTATGLGRVSKIQVGPQAAGSGTKTLGPALVRLLNEAITVAKKKAAQALDGAADPSVRDALLECAATPAIADKLAGETFSGASPDANVTVTASGTGEITKIKLTATAPRTGDVLAEQISAAANAAIDAAQRRQRELSGSLRAGEQDLDAALDAQLAAFNKDMDELLGRLGQTAQPPADAPEGSLYRASPPRHTPPRHRAPRHAPPRHRAPRHAPPRHRAPRHGPPRHTPPRHRPPRHGARFTGAAYMFRSPAKLIIAAEDDKKLRSAHKRSLVTASTERGRPCTPVIHGCRSVH